MIVSWKWLQDYVRPADPAEEVVRRLTMSGLNHEHTTPSGDDLAIDLEVTSNRPDCLGHIGIAREIATLLDLPLLVPDPVVPGRDPQPGSAVSIRIEAPDLCPLYIGRVIRGVRVGPSPAWMVQRLATAGIGTVNNVVDCTNYVMLECGQPLHAFDLQRLRGQQIVVRRPRENESITAINHQEYALESGMCVIADGERPVAIAGVMGGADSEVSTATTDLLIESAIFSPAAVRSAARRLNLHSPSSYRFERGVDPAGVDWASRRCCQLILQTCGGVADSEAVVAGNQPAAPAPVRFRPARIPAVLGVDVPAARCRSILQSLGVTVRSPGEQEWEVVPPTWRADLTREIDFVEEIGRITGYESVPDDLPVPLVASTRSVRQRALGSVRSVLLGAGFDEAMTPSLLPPGWSDACSPWTTAPALRTSQPMLGVLDRASQNAGPVECVRRTLIPSLLEARRINEHRGNSDAELFETATVYLPSAQGLPDEPLVLGLVSGRGFPLVRGVVDAIAAAVSPRLQVQVSECDEPWLDPTVACRLSLEGETLGWIGEVSAALTGIFGLRTAPVVAELHLDRLIAQALPVRRQSPVSPFPAVSRDFNFIVAEQVRWGELAATVRQAGGTLVESVAWRETFRDPQRDGAGMKRLLLSLVLRSHDRTLDGAEVEAVCAAVVRACRERHGARLPA